MRFSFRLPPLLLSSLETTIESRRHPVSGSSGRQCHVQNSVRYIGHKKFSVITVQVESRTKQSFSFPVVVVVVVGGGGGGGGVVVAVVATFLNPSN